MTAERGVSPSGKGDSPKAAPVLSVITAVTPLVMSAAVIVQRSVDMGVGLGDLPRPIAVVCVIATIMTASVAALTRSWLWGGLVSTAATLLLLRAGAPLVVAVGLVAWWPLLAIVRRLGDRPKLGPPTLPAQISAAFGAALLIIGLAALVGRELREVDPVPAELADDGQSGGPSIYMLLLDGYPREDTLATTFGIDNAGFAERLEGMGFAFFPDSRSNYTKTLLSLASVLNVSYLDSFVEGLPEVQGDMRTMHGYISHSSLLALLERRGYETWSIRSASANVAPEAVDHFVQLGRPTEFEVVLLQQSLIGRLAPNAVASFVADQEAAAVYDGIDAWRRSADPDPATPRFVFAHVLSPHAPFILGTDDPASALPACFPLSCPFWDPTTDGTGLSLEEYGAGLAKQIPALNDAVLDAVEDVVSSDPDAVVIVMSDHGSRYLLSDEVEQFRNILAVRAPGRQGAITDGGTLVNLFRYLTTAYFGTDLPALTYEAWLSDWSDATRLTRVEGVE